MSKRVMNPATRAAAVALATAGLGASLVAGAGSAFAAEGKAVVPTAATASAAVAAQAETQAHLAAQVKAAAAKTVTVKATAVKATATKKAVTAKKAPAWVKPVAAYTLSASFNQGGAMWAHKHSGQDFAVPVGTPVKAAATGTVVKAGPYGGGDGPAYGNAIVVKHGNGTYSQYAHLSKIQVKIGQKVGAGQKIALSGNTGNSSGPHLHFEIRTTPNYGSAVNPAAFLRAHGVGI